MRQLDVCVLQGRYQVSDIIHNTYMVFLLLALTGEFME